MPGLASVGSGRRSDPGEVERARPFVVEERSKFRATASNLSRAPFRSLLKVEEAQKGVGLCDEPALEGVEAGVGECAPNRAFMDR